MDELAEPKRVQHIKKRALKNKALSIGFDQKDLQDYVTGFHKRKKKRRKEANQKMEEARRRKLIEARKKRKEEKEFVLFGGALPETSAVPDGGEGDAEEDDEENEPDPVAGTMTYDNPDMKVIVTTSAITPEEDAPRERQHADTSKTDGGDVKKPRNVPPVIKKPLKKVVKQRSRKKILKKRDKVKGKRQSK